MMNTKTHYADVAMLRAFILTAQEGSTASAAKLLHVSQPAISTTIHRLEVIIGHELFDRTSRPMQLTVAGRLLKTRVEGLVLELDSVCSDISQIVNSHRLDLRIGFSDSISGCISPYLLARILPRVNTLSAYGQNTPKTLEKLLSGKLDIAICTKNPIENPDIISYSLFTENFIVVTPKEYANRIHSIHDLAVLPKSLPVVRFNDDSFDSIQIERVLRQCNIMDGRIIAADNNASVLGIVNQGKGWTVMTPLSIWMAHDHMDNVAFQEIDTLKACRTFYILYKNPIYANLVNLIFRESQEIIKNIIIQKLGEKSSFLSRSLMLNNLA